MLPVEFNKEMLDRQQAVWTSEPTVMDSLHKVYIYNPNYQKWEIMDETKKWMFKIKEANNWEENFIWEFTFWLIDVVKVMSWECIYKDEFGDSVLHDWKPAKDYFYTNEYPLICKNDSVLWFRKMKWDKESSIYFKKKDLSNMLRLPKVNWVINSFYELKKKQDNTTYRASSINESHIIYWIFLDWKYAWEYFIFYPKDNLIWFDYSKWEYVKPEEWTLKRVMEDSLPEWNKIRVSNWLKDIKNLAYSLVDLKLWTKIKEVMWKEFNVWTIAFDKFSALRWNNSSDVDYISSFRHELFSERFGWLKDPMKVIWVDKLWNHLEVFPSDQNTIVDCRLSYDFTFKKPKAVEWVKPLWIEATATADDAMEVFTAEEVIDTPTVKKSVVNHTWLDQELIELESIPF
jgi:hypothetical protein